MTRPIGWGESPDDHFFFPRNQEIIARDVAACLGNSFLNWALLRLFSGAGDDSHDFVDAGGFGFAGVRE